MINIASNDNKIAYGIKHFNIDTVSDLDKLNKNALTPGCTAFDIKTSTYYMLNGKKEWVKVNLYSGTISGGSGGGNDNPPEDDPIYDGGSIDGSDPV